MPDTKPVRIEVFIDGRYFYLVSNHYRYDHPIGKHIDPRGFMYFLRTNVAENFGISIDTTIIVGCHIFMGFPKALDKEKENTREWLKQRRINLHDFPIVTRTDGTKKERGVDVGLAVAALRGAYTNKHDVAVLVSADGDFIPLVKELKKLGKKMILPYWDLSAIKGHARSKSLTTNLNLIRLSDIPIDMGRTMEIGIKQKQEVVTKIFNGNWIEPQHPNSPPDAPEPPRTRTARPPERPAKRRQRSSPKRTTMTKYRGRIVEKNSINGYIQPLSGEDKIFFLRTDVKIGTIRFQDIPVGSLVEFAIAEKAHRDKDLAINIVLAH